MTNDELKDAGLHKMSMSELIDLVKLQEAALRAEHVRYESLAQEMARKIGQLQEVLRATDIEISYRQDGTLDWKRASPIPAQTGMPQPVQQPAPVAEPHYEAGRKQGRAEALAILMQLDPEGGIDEYTGWSTPVSPEDEGAAYWEEEKLRELFGADRALADMMDRAEAEYWKYLGMQNEAERAKNFAANMHSSGKVREVLSKAGEFSLMGQLCSAAPVAAPVDVPAASVQPEIERKLALNQVQIDGLHHEAERYKKLYQDLKMQPDSGRDERNPAFVAGERHANEQALKVTHALMAERDEWKAKALAQDGGRDAALVAQGRSAAIEACANAVKSGDVAAFNVLLKEALAAHPANVAQPVSDAAPWEIDVVAEAIYYHFPACMHDTKWKGDIKDLARDMARAAIAACPRAARVQVGELSDEQTEQVVRKVMEDWHIEDGTHLHWERSVTDLCQALAAAKKGG